MRNIKAESRAYRLKGLGHKLIDKLSKGKKKKKDALYNLIYEKMELQPWEERRAHFGSSIDPNQLQRMVWILEEENLKRELNGIRQIIKNEERRTKNINAQALELLIKERLRQVKEKSEKVIPWYRKFYLFAQKVIHSLSP